MKPFNWILLLVSTALFAGRDAGAQEIFDAIASGDTTAIAALLSAGTDVNTTHEQLGIAPVDYAFQRDVPARNCALTSFLVSHGAYFDPGATVRGGVTRLDMAVAFGNEPMTRFLIDRGADTEAASAYPSPPIVNAARRGYTRIVELLLDAGTDPDLPDRAGNPALRWTVERGHAAVTDLLLQRGASADFVDPSNGMTLLHLASLYGHRDIVTRLIDAGADVAAEDSAGRTPIHYASRYGHRSVARTLENHGATPRAAGDTDVVSSLSATAPLDDGRAVAWHLAHRGWAVQTGRHLLVFDAEEFGVTRPAEPSLANGFLTPSEIGGLDVLAFYTAYHGDPGEPAYIHQIEDSLESITYVHNRGDRWRGSHNTVYLAPGESATIGDVSVDAIAVTVEMTSLGYLVRLDGVVLYYAGFNAEDLDRYAAELESLAGLTDHVDMAFLPIVDETGDSNDLKIFVERLEPGAVFLLDPNRRVELFPATEELLREWGYRGTVNRATYPGDAFRY